MSDELDQRIKELEAQLKEQELRDKRSVRPLFTQSVLAALPIILTIGLGFLASYFQSQDQHREQLTVLKKQGELEREKQELLAREAERARLAQASQSLLMQEREAKAQRERQESEFAANALAAASRFAQEQMTLRQQHSAQQRQQAREFDQSLERQRRQAEVEVILKASEVPTSLAAQEQDAQRARNLLWYAQAGYIRLPEELKAQLRQVGRVPEGQDVALPVTQSAGGTAGIELAVQFESFTAKPLPDPVRPQGSYIGYSHDLTEEEARTGRVRIGDQMVDISNGISEEQARALLRQDMEPYYGVVDSLVKVPLTPFQRDALAVFVHNIGKGTFPTTTLLKRLNAGEYDAVPDEMMKWIKAGGKVLPGLRRRREAEIELWRRAG